MGSVVNQSQDFFLNLKALQFPELKVLREKMHARSEPVKCQRLLGPEFRKVKTSFVSEIRQVSDTLTLSEGVFDDTPV